MSDWDYEIKEAVTIQALPEVILVHNMEYGENRLATGIIVPDDNGAERGIRPRWGTVWSVGRNITDVKKGDKILVAHGRWSRGIKIRESNGDTTVIRRVDPNDILLVRD